VAPARIEFTFVDSGHRTRGGLRPDEFVFVETPTNAHATHRHRRGRRAHKKGIRVVVDSTFMSPYFQRPLELGATVAFHSVTKYLNGHSDLIAGALR
jgi:cystathionine gamma-lyase